VKDGWLIAFLSNRKRARYDSGEDLIDPSEMFAGAGGFPGGMGGMGINPEMLFNMMGGGGGGFTFSTAGGSPFGGGAYGGSRARGGNPFGEGYPF
jgi:DnaJ homolog subfamily C member 7